MIKLNNLEASMLKAKPSTNVDQGSVRWPQRKYIVKTRRGQITTKLQKRIRPQPKEYWNVLKDAGICVCECVCCGSKTKLNIHHLDGNPFNNSVDNLKVLCRSCHAKSHNIVNSDIIDDLDGIRSDEESYDSTKELDSLLGIVREE